MASAAQLLDVARSQLGVHEDPPKSNRTPYGEWYGMDGEPWCAMFASWCLHQVGIDDWRHAYTPTGFDMFRRAGRLHFSDPEPGDLVYFDFPNDTVRRISHVGFVESVNADGTINTIEGNTNTAGSRTGGNVLRHLRDPIKHGIRGYGRPDYDPPEEDFMSRLTDDEQHELFLKVRDVHAVLCDPDDAKYIDKRLAGARDSLMAGVRRLAVALKLPARAPTELGDGV